MNNPTIKNIAERIQGFGQFLSTACYETLFKHQAELDKFEQQINLLIEDKKLAKAFYTHYLKISQEFGNDGRNERVLIINILSKREIDFDCQHLLYMHPLAGMLFTKYEEALGIKRLA